jgi:hypothetical protein
MVNEIYYTVLCIHEIYLAIVCIDFINGLTYFVVSTGEGVAGKPLERSDWPRRTGMLLVCLK